MLQQEGAKSAEYGDLVRDILGLLDGSYRSDGGLDPHPVPGAGAEVEPWILGSSPGESAEVAGRLGLRFAASYHISPATALSAARAYREAFVPSAELERPYLAVSADVVVGPDDETARHVAAGYAEWVHSIRCGEGAIPFPEPAEVSDRQWTPEDEALVHDRVASRIVGSPGTVVQGLARLQEATQADELIVTTITHSHQDRVRSFALLAREWSDLPRQGVEVDQAQRLSSSRRR
jgi:luciferase family oxidoreductase group 1